MSLVPSLEPRAAGHERPEAGAVLAASGVVEVGQAEVVAELVREHADAAVLRLDGVLADPVVAVSDLDAAELVEARAGRAEVGGVRVPAVAPDGGVAEHATAGLVALASVERLEGVDVAVRLVEVAIGVVVVAVPDVEAAQVRVDLSGGLAGRDLRVVPAVDRVDEEGPDVGSAEVIVIAGGVAWHGDPIGHVAVDGVASGRLLDEPVAHRVGALGVIEQQVQIVAPAEVGLPDGGVIDRAIGLGDAVVRHVGELAEHRPDGVLALACELDELALGHFRRLAVRLAVELLPPGLSPGARPA